MTASQPIDQKSWVHNRRIKELLAVGSIEHCPKTASGWVPSHYVWTGALVLCLAPPGQPEGGLLSAGRLAAGDFLALEQQFPIPSGSAS